MCKAARVADENDDRDQRDLASVKPAHARVRLEEAGQIDFTSPPSMRSVEPVIQRAPGDTRKAISSAISSGSP
jgi:hypothetical protein